MDQHVLFSVPFRSPMDVADIAYLRSELGMTTNLHPKHPAVRPPLASARLDFDCGLFLTRAGANAWALECRTWGEPAAAIVRGWQLHAAYAAQQLDRGSLKIAADAHGDA
jgi:hypothetical protein